MLCGVSPTARNTHMHCILCNGSGACSFKYGFFFGTFSFIQMKIKQLPVTLNVVDFGVVQG